MTSMSVNQAVSVLLTNHAPQALRYPQEGDAWHRAACFSGQAGCEARRREAPRLRRALDLSRPQVAEGHSGRRRRGGGRGTSPEGRRAHSAFCMCFRV